MLALPAREQAEQRWQAAVAVLAQSMGVRLITHIVVQSLKKLAKNWDGVKGRPRATGQSQIANRAPPPVRGPVASNR